MYENGSCRGGDEELEIEIRMRRYMEIWLDHEDSITDLKKFNMIAKNSIQIIVSSIFIINYRFFFDNRLVKLLD